MITTPRFAPFTRAVQLDRENAKRLLEAENEFPPAHLTGNWENVSGYELFQKWLLQSYRVDQYPKGVVIVGGAQTGKSMLLGLIAIYIKRNFYLSMKYVTAHRLYSTFYRERDFLDEIMRQQILFIDGLGTQFSKEFSDKQFEEVIEYRFSHRLTTYIASSKPLSAYEDMNDTWKRIYYRMSNYEWMYPKSLGEDNAVTTGT